MHFLYGFLVATFVVHAIAFTILGVKRQKKYYFWLTGTFSFLTAIYLLKFRELALMMPGTNFPLIAGIRILAIGCTLTYLIIIARTPGTWLSRLLGKG